MKFYKLFLVAAISSIALTCSAIAEDSTMPPPAKFYRSLGQANLDGINPQPQLRAPAPQPETPTVANEVEIDSDSSFNFRIVIGIALLVMGLGLYIKNSKNES